MVSSINRPKISMYYFIRSKWVKIHNLFSIDTGQRIQDSKQPAYADLANELARRNLVLVQEEGFPLVQGEALHVQQEVYLVVQE